MFSQIYSLRKVPDHEKANLSLKRPIELNEEVLLVGVQYICVLIKHVQQYFATLKNDRRGPAPAEKPM